MTAAKEKNHLWFAARVIPLLFLLAAIAASEQARSTAENRVWQKSSRNTKSLLSQPLQLLELHQVKATAGWYDASDYTLTEKESSDALRYTCGLPRVGRLGISIRIKSIESRNRGNSVRQSTDC
jgi:hypothetical protein